MSWRTPYRSALRDLAQGLMQQAQVKRANDEQALQMELQQEQIRAETMQNAFNTVTTGVQNVFQQREEDRKRMYDQGIAYSPLVETYANQAAEALAQAEAVRLNNPAAFTDVEYNALVQANQAWQGVLTANPADWPQMIRDTLNMNIVPAGAPATVFSAKDIADGTAAGVLESPLTMSDILSRGTAYVTNAASAWEDSEAALERNLQLLDQNVATITGIDSGDGDSIINANLAADRIQTLIDSGRLPDTIDVETYSSYINQARDAISDEEELKKVLNLRRAEIEAGTAEATARTSIANFNDVKAQVDIQFYEDFVTLDYDTAVANLERAKFENEEVAWLAFQEYGFVSNEYAEEVEALYNANPTRDENGNPLTFEQARNKLRADHQDVVEAQRAQVLAAAEIAGIDVERANIQLDQDKYAQTWFEFDETTARADSMRTRIANAIAMGDVAYLSSVKANHPDILRSLGLYGSIDRAIAQATQAGNIIELQNTNAIAELNHAISMEGLTNMADRTAVVSDVLNRQAAWMTPEAIDNWWGSLTDAQKRMFGTEGPDLIEGAKRQAEVNMILQNDPVYQEAWREVNQLKGTTFETADIPAAKQRIVDILTPVVGAEIAEGMANSFANDWRNGNTEASIAEMELTIKEATVSEALRVLEESGPGALNTVDTEKLNTARQILASEREALDSERATIIRRQDEAGCLPTSYSFGNADTETCAALSQQLEDNNTRLRQVSADTRQLLAQLYGENAPTATFEDLTEPEVEELSNDLALVVASTVQNNELPEGMTVNDFTVGIIEQTLNDLNVPEENRAAIRDRLVSETNILLRESNVGANPVAPQSTLGDAIRRGAAATASGLSSGLTGIAEGLLVNPLMNFVTGSTPEERAAEPNPLAPRTVEPVLPGPGQSTAWPFGGGAAGGGGGGGRNVDRERFADDAPGSYGNSGSGGASSPTEAPVPMTGAGAEQPPAIVSPGETSQYDSFLSQGVSPAVREVMPFLIEQESGGRHRTESGALVESNVGALGKTQLMPETMIQPGYSVTPLIPFSDLPQSIRSEIVRYRNLRDALPKGDPGKAAHQATINSLIRPYVENIPVSEYIRFAGDYLQAMSDEFGGDMGLALAAYNAGPGRVGNALAAGEDWLQLVPQETRNYVASISAMSGGM